jgi:hypothetical protein
MIIWALSTAHVQMKVAAALVCQYRSRDCALVLHNAVSWHAHTQSGVYTCSSAGGDAQYRHTINDARWLSLRMSSYMFKRSPLRLTVFENWLLPAGARGAMSLRSRGSPASEPHKMALQRSHSLLTCCNDGLAVSQKPTSVLLISRRTMLSKAHFPCYKTLATRGKHVTTGAAFAHGTKVKVQICTAYLLSSAASVEAPQLSSVLIIAFPAHLSSVGLHAALRLCSYPTFADLIDDETATFCSLLWHLPNNI